VPEGLGEVRSRDVSLGKRAAVADRALAGYLHDVLTALPKDLRFQVSDMRIEPNLVRFDGQAESSVVAEKVAGAVRSTGKYDVQPPNSRALSGLGVSFDLVARPRVKTEEATP